MPSRDVEINLIAHDRTSRGTRSAARNLEQLARKAERLKGTKATVDVATNVDNNKIKKAFGDAGAVAGKSFRDRLRKFIGPAGFDGEFSRGVRNIPNLFGVAGQKARTAFRNKFGSPGLDPQFIRDVKRIPAVFTDAGTRARRAFRRAFTLGSAGFDPQFIADAKRIGAVFGRAGRSAGASFSRNFSRFATVRTKIRKVFKVDTDARRSGITAGSVFFRAFINTVTFGMAGGQLSAGMIRAAPKMAAVGAALGGVVATVMIAEITQALSAAASLFIGGGLLAGPIAFLLVQQAKASKETQKQEKAVAALRKRLNNATNKDTKARLQKQLAAETRILEELRKQSQQWDTLKAKAKGFMTFISAPLKIPLEKSMQALFDGFNKLKGPIREVMAALGTALPGFTKGAMGFFLSFIKALKPALPNIVLGLQQWGAVMPQIGKAVGDFLAKISSHPEAVQGFADSFTTFLGTAGDVIAKLQQIAAAYGQLEALLRGGRTGQIATEWGKLSGVFHTVARTILESLLAVQTALDRLFGDAAKSPFAPKWLKDFAAGIHAGRVKTEQDLAAMQKKHAETAAAFKRRKILAKIAVDIAGLKTKLAEAKAKLNDPKLSKTKKIQIKADIADLRLKIATARAQKAALAKKPSISKLQATKKDLEAKIRSAKSSLKGVHNQRTIAKIKGDIKDAQAKLRQVKAQIAGVKGKTVTIRVRAAFDSSVARARQLAGRGHPKGSADGGSWSGSGGPSWSAALSGGGNSRVGGPTEVNVAAPVVNTTVLLDKRVIHAEARTTVLDENRRNAYKARVGRR